jgi:shikimate dehydrogenase
MGMLGKGGATPPIDISTISKDAIVSDIVFMPIDTPLIKAAEARGISTHKGLGMLIHQGALSFELWFEQTPPIDVMRFAAVQALEVRQNL